MTEHDESQESLAVHIREPFFARPITEREKIDILTLLADAQLKIGYYFDFDLHSTPDHQKAKETLLYLHGLFLGLSGRMGDLLGEVDRRR